MPEQGRAQLGGFAFSERGAVVFALRMGFCCYREVPGEAFLSELLGQGAGRFGETRELED